MTPWEEAEPGLCHCRRCVDGRAAVDRAAGVPWHQALGTLGQMCVCATCGNKRCPKATYHDNECSGSNEPNQPGSWYQYPPPASTDADS